ncbi:hypothetical protein FisN_17Hh197 [Fistulifera solaris]|uniref:Uncharacterized protein n=1 Tax=Fistulifera solaris TaxID=1519565 RepID=A0A1Z5JGY3_FISSO|nr:hypothetical protein FisN_17Hh197 [Fistulifera solaris]|eukprot:GAX13260.1 hypothetical protein FisN_17Hh197 [Fistulifera solaris]
MPGQEKHNSNADIWSTRVQRELLALTTDNATAGSTDEVRSVIPSFVTIKDHKLDIGEGICYVDFAIELVTKLAPRSEVMHVIVVKVDASLRKRSDGSLDAETPSYPFTPPVVILESGAGCFPSGSTIRDGNRVPMDIDWTPSLHLTDAIMNVALKVKESIKEGEPFEAAEGSEIIDPVEELQKGARRFADNVTKGLSKAFGSKEPAGGKGTPTRSAVKPSNVKAGDEINLLDEPWVDARGVYSCKAIKRPAFVDEIIQTASHKEEQKSFKSAGAMLRSFQKSARSIIEETFLMITDTHIIELKASKLQTTNGTVTFCIPIDMLAKLKFRRQESLSLFFKPALDEPLIYMCPDSADAVHQIQSVLKDHGVRGKHTNAAAYRAINEAMQLVQEIQTKELALKHDPTVNRVNEIMDLYRQAAERFEAAGDLRHEEVVIHMRKFLALPLTVSILDGSFKRSENQESPSKTGEIPEGEVLERSALLLASDDTDPNAREKEKLSDKEFERNVDNLLKEVKEGFEQFKVDGDCSTDATASLGSDDMTLEDVVSGLDAMMREADKELMELMNA